MATKQDGTDLGVGPNLYTVLSLDDSADACAIRRAYKAKALVYHPDKRTGDVARFQSIARAFAILRDPQTRAIYDHGIRRRREQPSTSRQQNAPTLFTKQSREVIIIGIELTMGELLLGGSREVVVDIASECPTCNGTGAKEPHDFIRCLSCGGDGGTHARPCKSCGGEGGCNISTKSCDCCRGAGNNIIPTSFVVSIPACAKDAQQLKCKNVSVAARNIGCPVRFISRILPDLLKPSEDVLASHEGVRVSVKFDGIATTVSVFVDVTLAELLCGFHRYLTVFGENVTITRSSYDPVLGDPSQPITTQTSLNADMCFKILVFTRVKYPPPALIRPFALVFQRIFLPSSTSVPCRKLHQCS